MAFERQTAKTVSLADIVSGQWVKKEGFEPSFVVTGLKEKVARARVMGTVVGTFASEDGSFASITLDDGTDTIRCKGWRELKVFAGVETGQVVDVVGKVREYNGEIYMIPELIVPVGDPNKEILRRLEIEKRAGLVKAGTMEKAEEAPEQSTEEAKEAVRKEVLKVLEENKKGISYTELMAQVKQPEQIVESVVTDILEEGICYEPTPGKILKI